MNAHPMDCTTELGVKLQMLRFKLASLGEVNAVTLAPLIAQAETALTKVKQTQEDLAHIVLKMSEAVEGNRLLVAQLQDLVTRIVRAHGGRIMLSKADLETPILKGTKVMNGILEDGGLEMVVETGREAA